MSKAFTRESDDVPDLPDLPEKASALPDGARNYLTPDGARRLREELEELVEVRRRQIAPSSEGTDGKRRLRALDQRINHLQQSLQTAEVVPPATELPNEVRFGSTVTVRERNGEESQYRIVGVDETDFDRGWVSWFSPIARALLNARVGQRVRLRSPAGDTELEIVAIRYEQL